MHPDFAEITGPCVHTLKARASRLRAIASDACARLRADTLSRRALLAGAVQTEGTSAERIAAYADAACLAEAREEGYRAAVADLLGAVLS
jgi:hypothetical protein